MARGPGPLVLRKTYENQAFNDNLQLLLDRMAAMEKKDGPIANNYPVPHHAWQNALFWLRTYGTGRTHSRQYLLDVANFCMIEYLHPSFPKDE